MSLQIANPYQLLTDIYTDDKNDKNDTNDLTESCHTRKSLAYVDRRITLYQLEKLKLLACSVLCVGEVRDVESVTSIYELLKSHFAGDTKTSSSFLHTMLVAVGLDSEQYKCVTKSLERSSSLLANKEFQWRRGLIQYSDRAVRQNKVAMVIDHLYGTREIEMNRERATSLIVLFNHMIENRQFQPGKDEELEVIEEAFTIGKSTSQCVKCL